MDGLYERVDIQRFERPKVYDFCVDPVPFKVGGGLQRQQQHFRVRRDGDVLAFPFDFRLSDRDRKFSFLHVAFGSIEQLGFDEDDRVVVANGRFQQPFGILRSSRGNDFQAGHMAEPGFQALGMLGGQLVGRAAGAANDHGYRQLPAGHVADFGGVVDDLIQCQYAEVKGHQFDDRPQAGHSSADRQPGKSGFGNRGIENPLCSEFLYEPFADLEGALVVPDLFADQKHAGIALHFLAHGLV